MEQTSEQAKEPGPRISPVEFARQVRQEAGKVTWPTRKETLVTTAMVFVMVFLAAGFFFLVDQVLNLGVRVVLGLGS
jgi:preprotein translocase subunit SecE